MHCDRLALLMLVSLAGVAVQVSAADAAKEATGAVSGHVLCGDTNLPARMASVLLQPVYEAVPAKAKPGEDAPQSSVSISIAQTLLDGSYKIAGLKPGKYYVIVEKTGYLSPLALLTREDLNKPDDDEAALIARLLPTVTVTANHVASADARIVRGGSITGNVRFDDGSESSDTTVALLRRSKTGKWEPFRTRALTTYGGKKTDDLGRYRFTGLPEGEYLVEATLELNELKVTSVFSESRSSYFGTGFSLNIFPGGALRTRDAKSIKLKEGEEADLIDIEVPVSKLHSVSGNVVDASGRTVNAGRVVIVYTDDDAELTSAEVDKDDDLFHFYFVPEGQYTLKVTGAKDVTREEVPYPPGTMPPTHTEEKTVREYQDSKQPIIIHGDMSGVALTVTQKPAANGAIPPQ